MSVETEIAVSVIVPSRNRAVLLMECLETLTAQTCTVPYEIIVIDNASDDATPQMLTERSHQDPRLIVVREARLGRSTAMNAGIRRALGRVLLFTDDDVLVDPHWIASYWEFFAARPDQLIVAGGAIVPIPEDRGLWPGWVQPQAVRDLPAGLDWGNEQPLAPPRYLWGANMAVPSDVFRGVGLWNEILGHRGDERGTYEDVEFQERVRSAGGTVWFCPRCVVRHRVPRRLVTPRRVLRVAFTRGSNDYWRATRAPTRSSPSLADILSVGRCVLAGLLWSALFRLIPRAQWFDRARQSARRSGWTMERFTRGRRPQWGAERLSRDPSLDPVTRSIRFITVATSRLAERLVPDQPS